VKTVRSRSTGGSTAIDMVVTVDSGITTAEGHAIADAIEEELRAQLSVEDVTIHVEPDG
jgi:divalent metal cation (Fe/Co/Zn/Cd) transporter